MPQDSDFDQVLAGSLSPSACTPPIDEDDFDYRGIAIAAPKRVEFVPGQVEPMFGAFARVLLCGTYTLDSNYLGLREQFLDRLVAVAVDVHRHRAYSAGVVSLQNPVAMPDHFEGLMLTDQDWEGRMVTGFFNPNLAEVMPLPAEEATYVAYVALGRYVSNAVRIEVVRRRAD
ncbi:MAG: hypothetical protein JRI23_03265 [Deltaproteobacteria bacterium]|jgi:hypothetical protein|nr:hypothetical protein [Deltaproteobacteria bacterium]MBW2530529.1 hypothetical protein [Deltaproteobacteria bacterium]